VAIALAASLVALSTTCHSVLAVGPADIEKKLLRVCIMSQSDDHVLSSTVLRASRYSCQVERTPSYRIFASL
jgi:hypothetical protein